MESNKTKQPIQHQVVNSTMDVVAAPKSSEPLIEQVAPKAETTVARANKKQSMAHKSTSASYSATTIPWGVVTTALFFFVALSSLTYYAYLKSN